MRSSVLHHSITVRMLFYESHGIGVCRKSEVDGCNQFASLPRGAHFKKTSFKCKLLSVQSIIFWVKVQFTP